MTFASNIVFAIFQSTTPWGVTAANTGSARGRCCFNPHTAWGATVTQWIPLPEPPFQSTLPHRVVTHRRPEVHSRYRISIHVPVRVTTHEHNRLRGRLTTISICALAWGATQVCRAKHHRHLISICAPAQGERACVASLCACYQSFNPRPHAGEATKGSARLRSVRPISIHAPHAGGDQHGRHTQRVTVISIHAPTRGATKQYTATIGAMLFQSTPPRGGATNQRVR